MTSAISFATRLPGILSVPRKDLTWASISRSIVCAAISTILCQLGDLPWSMFLVTTPPFAALQRINDCPDFLWTLHLDQGKRVDTHVCKIQRG